MWLELTKRPGFDNFIAFSGKIGSLNDPNKAENAMLFALERFG
jgi:hypothetical protein